MLDFLRNLFGQKIPEGVIQVNDLHFVACFASDQVNTLTWDKLNNKAIITRITDEAMKSIYRGIGYNLEEYGYIEFFQNSDKGTFPYIRVSISRKGGNIETLNKVEEHEATPFYMTVLHG